MSSGFNTDVLVRDRVFHVQTEDRGPFSPVIDTTVYQNGRVVLRKSSNYAHYAQSDEFDPDDLCDRVEEQHRGVIEDLRSGQLAEEIAASARELRQEVKPEEKAEVDDLEVQLLNPTTWLSGGNVLLDLQTRRRGDRRPAPGVFLKAAIEGALHDEAHEVTSDENGRARIEFPLPPFGNSDAALLILANNSLGRAEIRFSLRSWLKPPVTGPSA